MKQIGSTLFAVLVTLLAATGTANAQQVRYFPVPPGSRPHDVASGEVSVIEPPTARQGARRVWSDSKGRIWVSEWNSGYLSSFDPASGAWRKWMPPGDSPRTYSVYVDDRDKVWITDFNANAILRFDPASERFERFASDRSGAAVRQMLGRAGEAWGAESGTDRLVVVTTR
ncbi:MAG: hypothetical protein KJZ83_22585 [Burkholderiaceae bacterium]|nr:hypothetical protein [Burkholderiaceae bacterium]